MSSRQPCIVLAMLCCPLAVAASASVEVVRHGAQVDLDAELHHEAVANGFCFH